MLSITYDSLCLLWSCKFWIDWWHANAQEFLDVCRICLQSNHMLLGSKIDVSNKADNVSGRENYTTNLRLNKCIIIKKKHLTIITAQRAHKHVHEECTGHQSADAQNQHVHQTENKLDDISQKASPEFSRVVVQYQFDNCGQRVAHQIVDRVSSVIAQIRLSTDHRLIDYTFQALV